MASADCPAPQASLVCAQRSPALPVRLDRTLNHEPIDTFSPGSKTTPACPDAVRDRGRPRPGDDGHPDHTSWSIAGRHLIEVGIPYSDPVADGPVIAASYHRALDRGVKVGHIFQTLRTLRAEGSAQLNETPLVVDGLLRDHPPPGCRSATLNDAATAGLDGLIVPDLPGRGVRVD